MFVRSQGWCCHQLIVVAYPICPPPPEGQQRESRIFSVKGLARDVARAGVRVQGRVWVWLGLGCWVWDWVWLGVQGQGMGVLSYGYQGCVDRGVARVGVE
jgi:hypothetical protein